MTGMGRSMEKGLVHIYCGDGKGKTTCAAGLAIRCAGAGGKVLWFQFLKKDTSSERKSLAKLGNITLLPGFSRIRFSRLMTDEERKEAADYYSLMMAEIIRLVNVADGREYDMLVLDEAAGAINSGMLSETSIIQFLEDKPPGLEVVLTGRNPSGRLLECADYISEIKKIKHPYDKGIKARKKIEL